MEKDLDYISVPETAKRLHVSRAAVWGWVKTGKLPAVRVGRNYRIAVGDLDKVIRKEA